VVSNTCVQWLSSCEERKLGRRMGVGAMGDGLAGRKYRGRLCRQVPRLNHHPWRRCLRFAYHPWRRCIAEVKPLGRGLKMRRDKGG
jgi:hypothetical protein